MTANRPKRILALDGGGIRGVLTLGFLEQVEQILREPVQVKEQHFPDSFNLPL